MKVETTLSPDQYAAVRQYAADNFLPVSAVLKIALSRLLNGTGKLLTIELSDEDYNYYTEHADEKHRTLENLFIHAMKRYTVTDKLKREKKY